MSESAARGGGVSTDVHGGAFTASRQEVPGPGLAGCVIACLDVASSVARLLQSITSMTGAATLTLVCRIELYSY